MTNTVVVNNRTYMYEMFWIDSKKSKITDSKDVLFPYPVDKTKNSEWVYDNVYKMFIKRLVTVQNSLKNRNMFKKYKQSKDCLICKQKNVTTGMFTINRIRWEDGLHHYVSVHHIKPSDKFINTVYTYQDPSAKSPTYARLKGSLVKKYSKTFVELNSNQILIMDALFQHGSTRMYRDKKKLTFFRYSEHSGLLDFNNNGLEKVIVSGHTTRIDKNDNEIYMPKNMPDAFDYEYIFHTHPATPCVGGRAKVGVLYEFPSVADIFHFIDHYNEGETQGSIIIAAEGMYIIKKNVVDNSKININEDNFYSEINKRIRKVQESAIKKYGTQFTEDEFYSVISQDTSHIEQINEIMKKHSMNIEFYPRVQNKRGVWIIETVFLPVHAVEI